MNFTVLLVSPAGLSRTLQDSLVLCRDQGLWPAVRRLAAAVTAAFRRSRSDVVLMRQRDGGGRGTDGDSWENLRSAADEELKARLATKHQLFTSAPKQTRK